MTFAALLILLLVAPAILGGAMGVWAWPARPARGGLAGAAAGALFGAWLLTAADAFDPPGRAETQPALGPIAAQCAALSAAIRANCVPAILGGLAGAGQVVADRERAERCRRNRAVLVAECVSRRHIAAMP